MSKKIQTIPIEEIIHIANSNRYPYFNRDNTRFFKAKQQPRAYRYENVGFFIESTKRDNNTPRMYSVRGFNFTKIECFDISRVEEFATLNQARRFLKLVLNSGLLEHFYWHVHYVNHNRTLEDREKARRVLENV